MPINLAVLRPGLYVVTRPKQGVTHFAILDIGNRLGLPVPRRGVATIVHMTPAGLGWNYFSEPGQWLLAGPVDNEHLAKPRLLEAMKNPTYDVFGNNCEHFANLVSKGVRKSSQVAAGVIAVAVLAGLAYFFRSKKGGRRQ
jgi:hypothetical protein